MKPPAAEPVDPALLPDLARATIREAKFPMLATVDASDGAPVPRVRPVSPVRTDEDFTVYIANLAFYEKTAQIAANPAVELAYLAPSHDQVRITGRAKTVTDIETIQSIWESNPLLRRYLGTPDNPELVLYRIVPERVRFMREWALEYHEVPLEG